MIFERRLCLTSSRVFKKEHKETEVRRLFSIHFEHHEDITILERSKVVNDRRC